MNSINYLNNYIEKYGDLSFEEKELNEVDILIFTQLVYTDFEGIVGYYSESSLKEAARLFYSFYSEEKISGLISISQKSAELLRLCAESKRFSRVRICHYFNSINDEIDKQFAGVHFILEDDTEIVAFRGTDVTVTGLKESAMLSYMFPVPAQIEALHYFQETTMMHSGDIILCGHSKGGNLAVFAAVNCSNSIKKRLKSVYEADAPGFPAEFFTRYDYQEIKHKIFCYTPQTSIIGRMLFHDAQCTIVHSANSGLRQHQVSSWKIDEGRLVRVEKYDYTSDLANDYINGLIDYISDDELELFFNALEHVATQMGVSDFYDLKDIDIKHALNLIDSITVLEQEQKDKFKLVLKKASTDFARLYLNTKKLELIEKLEQKRQRGAEQTD